MAHLSLLERNPMTIVIIKFEEGFWCDNQLFKSRTALTKYLQPRLKNGEPIKYMSSDPAKVSKINRGVFI
jgi:hypothetical protein